MYLDSAFSHSFQKWHRASVHPWNFGAVNFDDRIFDTQNMKNRKEVFTGVNFNIADAETGSPGMASQGFQAQGDFHVRAVVNPYKMNATILVTGQQTDGRLDPGV